MVNIMRVKNLGMTMNYWRDVSYLILFKQKQRENTRTPYIQENIELSLLSLVKSDGTTIGEDVVTGGGVLCEE